MSNYTISVPVSSIQKAIEYGANVTLTGSGISFQDGTTVTSVATTLIVVDNAYAQANVATGIATGAYAQANAGITFTQDVWNYANTIGGGSAIDNVARQLALSARSNTIFTQGVDDTQNTWISSNVSFIAGIDATQNTRLSSIETINNNQNTSITIIQGVDNTQNTQISGIQGVDLSQNSAIAIIQGVDNGQNTQISGIQGVDLSQNAAISIIQGVDTGQNTTITAVNNYAAGAYTKANNALNLVIGTTGTAAPSSGVMTITSGNGLTVTGLSNTITINTPQDVRTTASPTFNSLTLSNPLAISQGGTGTTSAAAALTALLPTGTTSGYVLTTGGPGTYYWAAGGGGGSSVTPGTTIASTRLSYIANGTGLAYTTPTYVPGASQLRVYFDGVRQFASEYTETSSTIVTFTSSPPSGTAILVEVDGFIINPYYANNITFTAPFGGIVSTANTIQSAIQDIETRKATLISPSFTGIATATTVETNASNTAIATTAFVKNSLNNSNTYTMSVSGNAGTVTNGVYTNGSYANPSWITSLAGSKITGDIGGNAGTVTNGFYTTSSFNLGTTIIAVNRLSATQSLTGINIDGNSGTVTNGVYTNGSYSDPTWLTLSASKVGLGTTASAQFGSLGIGTAASGVSGEIRATTIIESSSITLKENINPIVDALESISKLNGVTYDRKDGSRNQEAGLIAEDVFKILPNMVTKDQHGNVDGIAYTKLTAYLIEAVKELKDEIKSLKGIK